MRLVLGSCKMSRVLYPPAKYIYKYNTYKYITYFIHCQIRTRGATSMLVKPLADSLGLSAKEETIIATRGGMLGKDIKNM